RIDLLEHAAFHAPRRALGELLGRGVPEHHAQRLVHRDDRVGQPRQHRLEVHASARSGTALSVSGARSPAASRALPAAVIIAALSVHRRGGGMWTWMPCSPASARSAARSGPLAATPPVSSTR